MDTKIVKKKSKLKFILIIATSALAVSVFGWYFLNQKKTYNVKLEDVQVDEVTKGKFEDMLMVTAQTQSLNSSLINVMEGGAVKEIFAEDGQMVIKDQPIARVYNPNTEFNYLNQETGIMQQISQMRNSLLELKNQEFNQDKELLQSQNDYNTALQSFNLQKRLYEAEIGKKKRIMIWPCRISIIRKTAKRLWRKVLPVKKYPEILSWQPSIIPSGKWKKV